LQLDFSGFGKWGNQNKHFWGVFDENPRPKYTKWPFSQRWRLHWSAKRPITGSQRWVLHAER